MSISPGHDLRPPGEEPESLKRGYEWVRGKGGKGGKGKLFGSRLLSRKTGRIEGPGKSGPLASSRESERQVSKYSVRREIFCHTGHRYSETF